MREVYVVMGFFLLVFTLFRSKIDERLATFTETPLFMETTCGNVSLKGEMVVA